MTEHRRQQLKLVTGRISSALINACGDNSDLILLGEIVEEANGCHGCHSVQEVADMIKEPG